MDRFVKDANNGIEYSKSTDNKKTEKFCLSQKVFRMKISWPMKVQYLKANLMRDRKYSSTGIR